MQSYNKSLLSCRCRTKECQSFGTTHMVSWVLIQNPLLADQAGKGRRGQTFPPAISYGGFFLSEASTSVLADEPMPMIPAPSLQAVGSQTKLPLVHLPTSRIAPPWGKGDPPISVTGVLPRRLGKTQAGGNMW